MEMEKDRRNRLDAQAKRNFWMRSIFGGFVLLVVFGTEVSFVVGSLYMQELHFALAVIVGMVVEAVIVLKFLFPQIEGSPPEYSLVPIDEEMGDLV